MIERLQISITTHKLKKAYMEYIQLISETLSGASLSILELDEKQILAIMKFIPFIFAEYDVK